MEPGQLMPRLVFKDPADRAKDPHPDPLKVAKAHRPFKLAVAPALNQFRSANNRAEAIRWALTRIRERPAYEQLREHTRDIDRLKSEF